MKHLIIGLIEQNELRVDSDFKKKKSSLNLFDDRNGFLRLKGRFENANLNYEEKHPLILRDKRSYFTELIVRNSHERVLHHGVEATLANVRARY